MNLLNWSLIRYIFGLLLLMEALFMAMATGVAVYYQQTAGDNDFWALCIPTILTAGAGGMLFYSGKKHSERFTQKEGFLIVAASWVLFSLFGMLPYLIYGTVDNITDAFFETISGFTTTGATILDNIDRQPHGILFWRSLTQWIGGLGIVVFSLALLPVIGVGGTQMFNAEVSGLSVDKLRPKIQNTARRLWGIYIGLTVLCMVLFRLGPMDTFDAVNHGLTTLATGGFSTHQASIGFFHSSYIEYICGIFLFIASLNFSLFYLAGSGQWKHFWKNEEFRWFFFIVLTFILLFMLLEFAMKTFSLPSPEQLSAMGDSLSESFRTAFFHTLTIISSAGFQGTYYDYALWGSIFWIPTLMMMICGGCAGSTAGGIKVIRLVLLLKNTRNEFFRQLHPRSITSVRINGHSVSQEVVLKILAFLFIYVIYIVLGSFFMQCVGLPFDTAIGSTVSAFGNCGPGIGCTGPAYTYAGIADAGKWFLAITMLIGRLEIFTVLLIFTRTFWQK